MTWSLLEHIVVTSRLKYCTEFEALYSLVDVFTRWQVANVIILPS